MTAGQENVLPQDVISKQVQQSTATTVENQTQTSADLMRHQSIARELDHLCTIRFMLHSQKLKENKHVVVFPVMDIKYLLDLCESLLKDKDKLVQDIIQLQTDMNRLRSYL